MIHDPQNNAVALFAADQSGLGTTEDRQTMIRRFADLYNHVIVSFLVVEKNTMSAGIKHALYLCKTHQADMLIIDEYKTLSLPHKDLHKTLEDLVLENIKLAFAADGLVMEQNTLLGMHHLMSASMACDYEMRSIKIKKSLKSRKQKGMKLGGKQFGAASHESKIIHQILKLHNDGFSLQKICDLLFVNNIKTVLNGKWHPTTVKRIIERSKNKYNSSIKQFHAQRDDDHDKYK
jgi:DNA invertase Pin-like site-specific DNA recombinase